MGMKTLGFLAVDEKGRTTIPKTIRQELGMRANTQLRVDRSSEGIVELVPTEPIPHDQLWFHTPQVQAGIAKAQDDFRSGRSTRTTTPEDAQRFLDSLKESPRERHSRKD